MTDNEFIQYLKGKFRPSELAAFWAECAAQSEDVEDDQKMNNIEMAFEALADGPIDKYNK